MYAGKILLAIAKIPLNPLSRVTTVTAEYPLENQEKNVAIESSPIVAVTLVLDTDSNQEVILANENQEQSPVMSPLAAVLDKHDTLSNSSSSSHSNSTGSHGNSVQSARRSLVEQFSQVTMETENQLADYGRDHLATPATPPTSSNQVSSGGATLAAPVANQIPSSVTADINQSPPLVTANQLSVSDLANQEAHHFCVAIDIRSLRLLVDNLSSSMISGCYSYPFFGTLQPVILPPINATPFVECSFERSLCAFDFATPRGVLVTQLSKFPLVVELMQSENVVGGAQIMMSSVLNQPLEIVGTDKNVSRQCVNMRSGITSP